MRHWSLPRPCNIRMSVRQPPRAIEPAVHEPPRATAYTRSCRASASIPARYVRELRVGSVTSSEEVASPAHLTVDRERTSVAHASAPTCPRPRSHPRTLPSSRAAARCQSSRAACGPAPAHREAHTRTCIKPPPRRAAPQQARLTSAHSTLGARARLVRARIRGQFGCLWGPSAARAL